MKTQTEILNKPKVLSKTINCSKVNMKSYTVRDIPQDTYKKLRIKAAEGETSINKTILKSIEKYIKKGDMINDCEGCEHNFGWSIDCRLPSLTPCPRLK